MNKKTIFVLLLIIALASLLRTYKIGAESFWIDEGADAVAVTKYDGIGILKNIYSHGQILPEYYSETSDLPVYYFTLAYWGKLFSVSEVSLRLYSALFGTLALIFIFLTAKRLFNRKSALLASFLFALSIPAIEFSQEARLYSMYMFFGTASMYYLVSAIKTGGGRNWAIYALFTLLGMYTHYLFGILVLFQVLWLLFDAISKGNYKIISGILVVYIIIGIISLPLVPGLFRSGNIEPWWPKPTIAGTAKIFFNFAAWVYPTEEASIGINSLNFHGMNPTNILLVLSAAMLAILSYALILKFFYSKFSKKSKNKSSILFLMGWFIFPIAFGFAVSLFTPIKIFGSLRYVLYCLPPFIMLLSESILNLKKYSKALVIIFVLLAAIPLYSYYSNVNNQQWREASLYLKNKVLNEEPIIMNIASGQVVLQYYYRFDNNIHGIRNADDAKKIIGDKNSFWLVLSFWKYYDPQGNIQKYANGNYNLADTKHFFGIDVYHYKKK